MSETMLSTADRKPKILHTGRDMVHHIRVWRHGAAILHKSAISVSQDPPPISAMADI
jgi:hypothetical protein